MSRTKNTVSEIKNSLHGVTKIINTAEEKIYDLEDIAIKAINTEAQAKKKAFLNNGQSLSDLWNNVK